MGNKSRLTDSEKSRLEKMKIERHLREESVERVCHFACKLKEQCASESMTVSEFERACERAIGLVKADATVRPREAEFSKIPQ